MIDVFVDELDLADLRFDGVDPEVTGRPSYHPSVLLKLYIYGYLNRVQSSRRLEREAGRKESELRQLRERKVDLILGQLAKPIADIDDVNVEFFFDDPFFVVAGKNSPWARRSKIDLAELTNERWIMAPPHNAVRSLFVDAFRARGFDPPQVKVVSNSMHVRMHLLSTGRFLTVLASSLLHHNADRWSFKVLPVDLGVQQLPVGIVTLRRIGS